jgi:hypothetical protein
LKNTSIQSIINYVTLQNAFKYKTINHIGTEIGEQLNICFPLYYIPLKIASKVNNEISFLRLFTVIFGVLTPIMLFLVGRRYSMKVGFIAALLVLFHPWAQQQSQHIRFYECWALISTLGLWYVDHFLKKLYLKQIRIWHMFLLAIVLLLPCTVHAFGVLTTFFLGIVVLFPFITNFTTLPKFSKPQICCFFITFIPLVIIISVNLLVFGYASMFANHPAYTQNSESAIHIVLSAIFNFGYFYIGLYGLLIIFAVTNWNKLSLPLKQYGIAFFVSSLAGAVITIKPHAFRPDFFYGMLPSLCLLLAFQIEYFSQKLFRHRFVKAGSLFVTGVLVLSSLQTLISDIFIDFDRVNFSEAAMLATKLDNKPEIFAPHHNYFNAYLKTELFKPMAKMNPDCCISKQDEYFFIGMRKGKSMQFFYDITKLKNVQLVQILGKSRLDLRSNHIYVFCRKCGQ